LAPTNVNLAKKLGVSRISIWKLHRRHPWLNAWCDSKLLEWNAHYWGLVERRMAMTALQGGGSVAHADQFCKMRSGHYGAQRRGNEGEPQQTFNSGQAIYNFLVPQPAMPQIPGAVVVQPEALALPAPDPIPEVVVRSPLR
jgi:hypothetical protein